MLKLDFLSVPRVGVYKGKDYVKIGLSFSTQGGCVCVWVWCGCVCVGVYMCGCICVWVSGEVGLRHMFSAVIICIIDFF